MIELKRVISGGQCGVDVAAVRAAKRAGLQTGGTMPHGWRTLDGPRPEYAAEFGMVEHPISASYTPRTLANVLGADATLRIAADLESQGELCTWAAIVRARSRHLDVRLERVMRPGTLIDYSPSATAEEVASWIVENRIATLNVAGNSTRTAPGIERAAEVYLDDVFAAVVSRQDGEKNL